MAPTTPVPLSPPAWFNRLSHMTIELDAHLASLPPGKDHDLLAGLLRRLDLVVEGMAKDLLHVALRQDI